MNKPAGVVDGDLLVVVTYREDSSWNLPADWAWLGADQASGDGSSMFCRVAQKLASGEGGSWIFNTPGTTWRVLTCAAFSGATGSAPFFDSQVGAATSATTVTGASVTTSYANSIVILNTGNWDGTSVNEAASGMTQGPELGGNEIFYVAQAGAGASGTKALAGTVTGNQWAALTTALWPAGAGGGAASPAIRPCYDIFPKKVLRPVLL